MIQWAVTSSILILLILVLRALVKGRISLRLRYALWLVVAVRLLVPFQMPELGLPTAASLVPEAPSISRRPLSPDTARVYSTIPIEIAKADGYTIQEDGTVKTDRPSVYPVLSEDGTAVLAYQGGFTIDDAIRTALIALWLTGAVAVLLAMLISNLRFSRSRGKKRRPLDLSDVPLPVYAADGLPSPCLFGLFTPSIYVTPEVSGDETALRHVLAHELTHYAHLDHLWSPLRCLCLALHWYNPLVWLAVILSKRDGELACDEGAVQRLGEGERLRYGRTLVDMVAPREFRPGDLLSCSTAMTGGKKSIQQRVVLLVKRSETKLAAAFLAVAAVALAAVFTFSSGKIQESGDLYNQFRTQVTSTQAIRMSPSAISSTYYPYRKISDPGLLKEAKNILCGADLLNAPEEEDWSLAAMKSSCFTLSAAEPDLNDTRYYLYEGTFGSKDVTYVLAHITSDTISDYTPVAILDGGAEKSLWNLAKQEYEQEQANAVPLSGQELIAFNQEFLSDRGINVHNQFLTSLYDRPEDIDLYELFYLGDGSNEPLTQEELRAVFGDYGEEGPMCGCDKLTRAGMDKVLSEHMELTLSETNQVGLENFLYLPQYNAYYNPHGDTNYYANVNFHSGFRQGDQVFLYYNDEFMGRGPCRLTMRETPQHHYLFVANEAIASRSTQQFAAALRPEDISMATLYLGSYEANDLELSAVFPLIDFIPKALKFPVAREFDPSQHSRLTLSLTTAPSGQTASTGAKTGELWISTGTEANLICFYYLGHDINANICFAYSPEIFGMIQDYARMFHHNLVADPSVGYTIPIPQSTAAQLNTMFDRCAITGTCPQSFTAHDMSLTIRNQEYVLSDQPAPRTVKLFGDEDTPYFQMSEEDWVQLSGILAPLCSKETLSTLGFSLEYGVYRPDDVNALTALYLEDTDTWNLNNNEVFTDWLSGNPHCYVIQYTALPNQSTPHWYAQAIDAGGSSYYIELPDSVRSASLSIACRSAQTQSAIPDD